MVVLETEQKTLFPQISGPTEKYWNSLPQQYFWYLDAKHSTVLPCGENTSKRCSLIRYFYKYCLGSTVLQAAACLRAAAVCAVGRMPDPYSCAASYFKTRARRGKIMLNPTRLKCTPIHLYTKTYSGYYHLGQATGAQIYPRSRYTCNKADK